MVDGSLTRMRAAMLGAAALMAAPLPAHAQQPMATAPAVTAWPSPHMDALEPLYLLAPNADGTVFYRSLDRHTSDGRVEMWVVAFMREIVRDPNGHYDTANALYSIDCKQRTIQPVRGQVMLNYAATRDTGAVAAFKPEPGSVGGKIAAQACDRPPLPPFGGSTAQIRRTIPVAATPPAPPPVTPWPAAPPPVAFAQPAPAPPAAPLPPNCTSDGICYYAVVAHVNDEPNAYQRSYDGTRLGWGIRVSDTPNAVYSVPFTICGKQIYGRPSDETKIRGYMKPTSEAYARRFSLSPYDGGFPICAWVPPRYTGPNR